MGRNARDRRPKLRPVERIELNEEHVSRRLILAAALLLLGVGLLVYSFIQFLNPQTEWTTITANSGGGPSGGEDFSLIYQPGAGGSSASAERKGVTVLYTSLARKAFELFHADQDFDGVVNIYTINRRPNEVLEVDPGLYAAISTVVDSGSRAIYLGPVYSRYFNLFLCQDDVQLIDFDPRLSEDVAAEYREVCAYANDPDAIDLELLGENKVRLKVSEDYLAYAEAGEIEDFIGFSWMTNAFAADFIADGLISQGYAHGVLTSYDGFCRNLDRGDTGYTLPLYSRQGNKVYTGVDWHYQGPGAVVSLRDYPLNDRDRGRFYTLRAGERRTPYLDPADGFCRNALPELTCYSGELGCGAVLLAMLPVYVAEEFDAGQLDGLKSQGIESLYWEGFELNCTDSGGIFEHFYDKDGVTFSAAG